MGTRLLIGIKRLWFILALGILLGVGTASQAWWSLPRLAGGGTSVSGDADTGWTTGVSTYQCLHDAPSMGDADTGAGGGLVGANLILTASAGVGGATGDPNKHRAVALLNGFTCTDTLQNSITTTTPTLIFKFSVTDLNAAAELTLLDWFDAGDNSITIKIADFGSGTKRVGVTNNTNTGMANNTSIAHDIQEGQVYWFAYACDGAANSWIGLSRSKPTNKASFEFTAAGTGVAALNTDNWAGARNSIWSTTGPINSINGEVYYFVASGSYLF